MHFVFTAKRSRFSFWFLPKINLECFLKIPNFFLFVPSVVCCVLLEKSVILIVASWNRRSINVWIFFSVSMFDNSWYYSVIDLRPPNQTVQIDDLISIKSLPISPSPRCTPPPPSPPYPCMYIDRYIHVVTYIHTHAYNTYSVIVN